MYTAPVAVGVCETMGILNDTACQRECNTTFGASHTFREITVNETDAQPQVKNQCTCINWWNGSSYDPEIDLCEGMHPQLNDGRTMKFSQQGFEATTSIYRPCIMPRNCGARRKCASNLLSNIHLHFICIVLLPSKGFYSHQNNELLK